MKSIADSSLRGLDMDHLLGKLVFLTLLGLFVTKLISSVRKLNEDKIGTAISIKRYRKKDEFLAIS